ncbi:hypothetical protein B0I35DRAFT_226644 [Stachybotrys elegans]|uniref:Uncharacterized protein n=1 Tax=Stachybotrys elegans TaxID=80388 RepID=A0A8K0WRJ6_9HYPO|nr:hypothetical protein B0I35DRAFT_226644 [Stachybotrys elegans]
MAPVRRYLRISKYSVLECRIYLENPSLAQSWLLNPRNPILPQVIEAVRPLVLPKLREENERSRKKSTKKKSIKDVIVKDDFEVSMFLTETSTRHSILTKHKHFREKLPGKMQSNSSRLIRESSAAPIDVDAADMDHVTIQLDEEDDIDDSRLLSNIPLAPNAARRSKRTRHIDQGEDSDASDSQALDDMIDIESDEEQQPPHKRPRKPADSDSRVIGDDDNDDKKKLAMDISYEGFAIYGRMLCLVVKRRDTAAQRSRTKATTDRPAGQASVENWISSTQNPAGEEPA